MSPDVAQLEERMTVDRLAVCSIHTIRIVFSKIFSSNIIAKTLEKSIPNTMKTINIFIVLFLIVLLIFITVRQRTEHFISPESIDYDTYRYIMMDTILQNNQNLADNTMRNAYIRRANDVVYNEQQKLRNMITEQPQTFDKTCTKFCDVNPNNTNVSGLKTISNVKNYVNSDKIGKCKEKNVGWKVFTIPKPNDETACIQEKLPQAKEKPKCPVFNFKQPDFNNLADLTKYPLELLPSVS